MKVFNQERKNALEKTQRRVFFLDFNFNNSVLSVPTIEKTVSIVTSGRNLKKALKNNQPGDLLGTVPVGSKLNRGNRSLPNSYDFEVPIFKVLSPHSLNGIESNFRNSYLN